MDHEVDVVQQDPICLVVAFDVSGPHPGTGESLLYLIGDGLNLSRVAAAANNKVVGEGARGSVHLKDGQILGFFLFASLDRFVHLAPDFRSFGWQMSFSSNLQS